ncbi:MAG: nucleotidyl transferase AbiEii/AbiGii toxin family protein [Candidatus Gottesmanbacteria bacterium]|nr:nucleotidyl transferase AbiEii/AbiGii toxin family protein [Candidatus Gottesmanbacteria bacterium]
MFGAVLSQAAQAALATLAKSAVVHDGYLAGGSALALRFGHRYSLDFDFFSEKHFDPHHMSDALSRLGSFQEDFAKGISLIGTFNGIKMSYFQYPYPLLEKTDDFLGVGVAHHKDIAAMKIVAIGDRSTRKDYIDIYELVQQGHTIDEIFSWYDAKYHKLESNTFTILRSLTYFDEAEEEAMPEMLHPYTWDQIKQFFIKESVRLAKTIL